MFNWLKRKEVVEEPVALHTYQVTIYYQNRTYRFFDDDAHRLMTELNLTIERDAMWTNSIKTEVGTTFRFNLDNIDAIVEG